MIKNRVTESMANVILRQIGAVEIKSINAFINKVKFRLDENTNVTYIYEVKENESIYLTRVRPYSLFLGDCADEQELIRKIEKDYFMFRAAFQSPHFKQYLQILHGIQTMTKEIEPLFMQRSISAEELNDVDGRLQDLYQQVMKLRENADDTELAEEMKRQEREVLGFELDGGPCEDRETVKENGTGAASK